MRVSKLQHYLLAAVAIVALMALAYYLIAVVATKQLVNVINKDLPSPNSTSKSRRTP